MMMLSFDSLTLIGSLPTSPHTVKAFNLMSRATNGQLSLVVFIFLIITVRLFTLKIHFKSFFFYLERKKKKRIK